LLKDFLKGSFLLLLLILPFNITYQLPYQILGIEIANPFVNGIIVNYLIPTLSILDLSIFLILISILLTRKIDLKWKGFSFLKVFTLFAVYLAIQSIFKGSFLSLFNSFRLLIYLFTFYNLSKHIKSVLNQKTYIYLLIGSIFLVLFQGVVALLQFSGGTSLGLSFLGESQVVSGMRGSSFLELNNSLYLRGYGTFPHPNIFGGWLIFNILLGWFLFGNMHKKRDYAVILMGISSLVLVLTFSRISLLVCLLIWIAFIVKSFVNSKRIKNFAFFGLISERFMNLFTGGDTSWSDRVGLMESSFHMIKQNLLTGVGLGGFIENMGDTVPRSSNGILLLQPVHNIFLLIVSEIGLVGFGLFSTLIYFFFKNRDWGLRFVMGLVGIFIISMFDHYLVSLPQGVGVFFFMVLL
jgi:O-antigen ligase